ncbi:MAG: acylneuraminate cytidylyltransferase family protein, partial [Bacteroidales bacterium]
PLLAWSIRAALQSSIFTRIILSTDSESYAAIGLEHGAEVPWLRDRKLADDDASSVDVILDIIRKLGTEGTPCEWITLLQPTSPLRTADDIRDGWRLLQEKSATSVVGVCAAEHPPQWCNLLPEDLSMKGFIAPEAMAPRQLLPQYYRVNGALYMASAEALLKHKSFFTPETYALVMPRERSVDIDSEFDFAIAEALITKNQTENHG